MLDHLGQPLNEEDVIVFRTPESAKQLLTGHVIEVKDKILTEGETTPITEVVISVVITLGYLRGTQKAHGIYKLTKPKEKGAIAVEG